MHASLMTVTGMDGTPVVSAPRRPTPEQRQPASCPRNCTEAHSMGMNNMRPDHACYLPKFDRDRDGTACERQLAQGVWYGRKGGL